MIAYNYCSACGQPTSLNRLNIPTCASCNISYYQNSKPTAGVLPVKDGKVLLAIRAEEPYKGEIDVIGGFLEDGEHPEDGVKREAKEETNLTINPTELLDIFIDKYSIGDRYTLNIYYVGEIIGGEMKAMADIESLMWVNISDLPISGGFQCTTQALKSLKTWYQKQKFTSSPQ